MGIAAFCLVPLFGLLPVGLHSNQNATEQTAAASIAHFNYRRSPGHGENLRDRIFVLRLNVSVLHHAVYHTLWIAEGGAVTGTKDSTAPATIPIPRYRAYITLTPPPSGAIYATAARLLITWPALADKTANIEPSQYSGSYEAVTALDRNP